MALSASEREMLAKISLIAMDQITVWTDLFIKAKSNPGMSVNEADALVARTKQRTLETVEAWEEYRNPPDTGG